MTAFTSTPTHLMMTDACTLLPEGRDIASHWAEALVIGNPAFRYIVGKYVEADNPNRNMQQWSLADLPEAQISIRNSPLNVLHRQQHVVGSYIGSELLYPTSSAEEGGRPFIEAAAAFWAFYFPDELKVIEKAHNEGSLFYSMECIGKSMTFIRPDGTHSEEMPYLGAYHESYGEDGSNPENIRQINHPHFLGGALIFPPKRPGWKDAKIHQVAEMVNKNAAEAEELYSTFEAASPHLESAVWEAMMLEVMTHAKGLQA
jgi:hypothetical protein